MNRTSQPFTLETDRLTLRDWRDEDIAPFLEHTNTPDVMRWLGGVMSVAVCGGFLFRNERCREANGFCFWIVERKSDGEILGFCGLKRVNTVTASMIGEHEIGWRLRQDAWGQGYAKEAAIASLAAAFDQFGAPIVHALTVQQNESSWGLMRRLGMQRRPDLDCIEPRWGEELQNVIVHSITQDQWREI